MQNLNILFRFFILDKLIPILIFLGVWLYPVDWFCCWLNVDRKLALCLLVSQPWTVITNRRHTCNWLDEFCFFLCISLCWSLICHSFISSSICLVPFWLCWLLLVTKPNCLPLSWFCFCLWSMSTKMPSGWFLNGKLCAISSNTISSRPCLSSVACY